MTINNTVEMIERTTARLLELSAEIPSVDTAWRDAIMGKGDPTVLIKKLDALRTEQSVESARLEALQARQSEEQAASGDLVAQAASVQANELMASFEDAMQAVRDGRICNAATIIGLQWLALNRDEVRGMWK